MLRELNQNEMEKTSGGCPLDLRGTGLSAADAASICLELARLGIGEPSSPSVGTSFTGTVVRGFSGTRIPSNRRGYEEVMREIQ